MYHIIGKCLMLMYDILFESYMRTARIFRLTLSFVWVICDSPRKKDSKGKQINSIVHLKKKVCFFFAVKKFKYGFALCA